MMGWEPWSYGREDRKKHPHCEHILFAPLGSEIWRDAATGQMVCVPCGLRLNALGLFPLNREN